MQCILLNAAQAASVRSATEGRDHILAPVAAQQGGFILPMRVLDDENFADLHTTLRALPTVDYQPEEEV